MAEFQKVSQKAQEFRRREENILSQALALFLERGEDKVTVEMIADRVGIGKGTIYKHFETKSEIYLRLMIRYEEELADLFRNIDPEDEDKDGLIKSYFRFRMSDPQRYALFDRLEAKCIAEKSMPELVEKLHEIRASNADKLRNIIQQRIDEGLLENVPPYFHVCAAWALVHGAVALNQSDFYQHVIKDQEGFLEFLMDIGARMGNKGQYRRKSPSSMAAATEVAFDKEHDHVAEVDKEVVSQDLSIA